MESILEIFNLEIYTVSKRKILLIVISISLFLTLGICAAVVLVYKFMLFPVEIVGYSMEPNYRYGEKYLVYSNDDSFERGDVIIYEEPENRARIVGRIIGISGDSIRIDENHIVLNGIEIDEGYLSEEGKKTIAIDIPEQNQEVIVPDLNFYILGDNRPNSLDSRSEKIGFVSIEQIVGKVGNCYSSCQE